MRWYVFNDGGYITPWGSKELTFKTKADAIGQLTASYLDRRKRPEVKRLGKGLYEYIPHTCDGETGGSVYILKESEVDTHGFRETINGFIEDFNS